MLGADVLFGVDDAMFFLASCTTIKIHDKDKINSEGSESRRLFDSLTGHDHTDLSAPLYRYRRCILYSTTLLEDETVGEKFQDGSPGLKTPGASACEELRPMMSGKSQSLGAEVAAESAEAFFTVSELSLGTAESAKIGPPKRQLHKI